MSGIDIDTALIERLASLLEKSGLAEIEISQGETRIRLTRAIASTPPGVHFMLAPQGLPVPPAGASGTAVQAETTAATASDALPEGTLTAPMVGTVYLSPEPGAPPFVQVGDVVEAGQTLLIIEAMKVMNQIRAPRAGKIARIFVENAQPVEYGEPLLVIA